MLRVRHWQMLDKFFDSGELKLAIFMTPPKMEGGGGHIRLVIHTDCLHGQPCSVITCKASLISM